MKRKSLLALLLVIVMTCCTIFAAAAEPFTVTLSAHIDGDNLAQFLQKAGVNLSSQVPAGALDAVYGLFDKIALRAVIDNNAVQADVLVSGQPIAYVAGQIADEGITVVTDLLPSYAAFITTDEIQQLFAQLKANMAASGFDMDNFNPEDIMYLLNTALVEFNNITNKITSSYGPEESGSWNYANAEFTTRQKLNMTSKELALTALEAAKNFTQDQKVQSILASFGADLSSLDLDKVIEECSNTPDDQFPPVEVYRYTNASGDGYGTLTMPINNNITLNFAYGMVGGNFVAKVSFDPDFMLMDLLVDTATGEFTLTFDMNIAKMNEGSRSSVPFSTLSVYVTGRNDTDGYNVETKYAFDGLTIMSLNAVFAQGGEITASFDRTGKTLLSLQDILTLIQGGNSELLNGISSEITTNGIQLLTKLMTLAPTEMTTLMTVFTTGM